MVRRVEIFTDGACLVERTPNPDKPGFNSYASHGVGGWAWWVNDDLFASGGEAETTNQRMEMYAVLEAMREFEDFSIRIFSDSAYVVNCFRDSWWRKWRANGWVNSKKQPVANQDLWGLMIPLWIRNDVELVHIRGHQGIHGNEKADKLAVAARLKLAKEL